MKMCKCLLGIIAFLILSVTVAYAVEIDTEDIIGSEYYSELMDSIPQEAEELMGTTEPSELIETASLQELYSTTMELIGDYMSAPIAMLVAIIGIMLLCSMLQIFYSPVGDSGSGASVFRLIVTVAAITPIISPIVQCINNGAKTLESYSYFTATFIPILSGVMTASGKPMTASAFNMVLFWVSQMVSNILSQYFVPVVCAYLALAVISVICTDLQIDAIVDGVKTFITWVLSLSLTIFLGVLTLQSAVAGSTDKLSVRTTKFMIGSLVPGVGGALADLFVVAQGWLELAKGSVGLVGIIVTMFTFLPMLVQAFLWYITLNSASIAGKILGVGEVSKLMKNMASAIGILLAVLLYQALLVIISTTMMIVSFV